MSSEQSSSSHSAPNVRELDSNDPMSPKLISPNQVVDGSVNVDAVKLPALPSVDDDDDDDGIEENDDLEKETRMNENVEQTDDNADIVDTNEEGIEIATDDVESQLSSPPIIRHSRVRPSASKAGERVSSSGGDSKPGAVSISDIPRGQAEEPLGQTVDKGGESTQPPRARPSTSKANQRISLTVSDEVSTPGAISVTSPVGQRRSKTGAAAALRRSVNEDDHRDSINGGGNSIAGSVYTSRSSDASEAKLRASALRMAPALDSTVNAPQSPQPTKDLAISPTSNTESPQMKDDADQKDAYFQPSTSVERGVDDSDGATMLTAEVAPDIDEIVNNAVQRAVQQTLEATQSGQSPRGVSVAQQVIDPEQQQPVEASATVYNGKQGDDDDEEEGKILGLPKKIFFIILAALLIIIIGVSVGVASSGGNGDDADNGSREIPSTNDRDPTNAPAVAAGLPTNTPSESPSMAPSSTPTVSPLSIYGEVLLPGVQVSAMDQSSAEYKGLQFIATEDTFGLEPTKDPRLLERFALAVLYYSTNGAGWTDSFRWLTGADHCNWHQVNCNAEDRVTKLDGTLNNVTGTLPTQVGHLLKLEVGTETCLCVAWNIASSIIVSLLSL